MKCEYCKEKIEQNNVAYWKGMRVHPECCEKLKRESKKKNPRRKSFMDRLWEGYNKKEG